MKVTKVAILVSFLASMSSSVVANTNIHFTEYRILLTEKDSKADYQIYNQGNTDAQCSAKFVDYNIDTNGKIKLAKNGELPDTSAYKNDLVRLSPKNFTVDGNGSQTIKVIGRRLRAQEEGEWVSYLGISCKEKTPQLQTGVNITPSFHYHIPVVVRTAQIPVELSIENAKFSSDSANGAIQFGLKRVGNRSVYGDIEVRDANGEIIGLQKGISHYQQSTVVPFSVNLNRKPAGSTVTLTFKENKGYGGTETVESIIDING